MDNSIFPYLESEDGKAFFERICREETAAARNVYLGGIGTLAEKRMHRVLKRAVSDPEFHEIRLTDALAADGIEYTGKNRRIIADAFYAGEVFEAQTGNFRPLKAKLEWIFENTPYDVTVIHPVCTERYLCWIDTETGEISPPHKGKKKSPKTELADSLYWIQDFMSDPAVFSRLRIALFNISAVEYRNRDGWGKDRKKHSTRSELIPQKLNSVELLYGPGDIADLFLENVPSEFTASDYVKISGIRGMKAYSVLHVLERLGYVFEDGKQGRSNLWHRK